MTCRSCGSSNIFTGIDLGNIPIAGSFLASTDQAYDLHETKMLVCSSCGLGQISKDLDPDQLYSNYNWRTSTSKSYVSYIKDFADKEIIPDILPGEWVLEIASNDGTLLRHLVDNDIDVLGVDPAKNISMYAICDGVPVITDFFNATIAKEILRIKGNPKRIVANNVMAHTPDINSFMEGISILADENTIITIENPTIMNILNHQHFDVIFHEHYSYLSANAIQEITKKYGLKLFNIKTVDIQGGSNRYYVSKSSQGQPAVLDTISEELDSGLFKEDAWKEVSNKIQSNIINFKNKVSEINNNGGVVCGFAASAKSTITINFAKIELGQIKAVADDVMEKQGMIIPGAMIPIVSTEDMLKLNPTDIVVFSWNIFKEIEKKIRDLGSTAKVWVWND